MPDQPLTLHQLNLNNHQWNSFEIEQVPILTKVYVCVYIAHIYGTNMWCYIRRAESWVCVSRQPCSRAEFWVFFRNGFHMKCVQRITDRKAKQRGCLTVNSWAATLSNRKRDEGRGNKGKAWCWGKQRKKRRETLRQQNVRQDGRNEARRGGR